MRKIISYQHSLSCAALFLLVFIAFWPSLNNDFLHYDEMVCLTKNPLVRDLSWGGVTRIFTSITHGGLLFPLSTLTHAVEYHFFQLSPWIYHFDNLLLHGLNAVLVYVLVWLISGRPMIAVITSVLFAVSPLRVESVAWVAERRDVLYAAFFLGSLISYVYAVRNGPVKKGYLYAACGLFVLSLLSKLQALPLPLVLVALDFLYDRISMRNIFIEKAPFWMITIGYALAVHGSFVHQAQALPPSITGVYSSVDKFFLTFYAVFVYFFKNFAPSNLSLLYPYPEKARGYFHFFIYCSPALIGVMILLLIKFAAKHRQVFFALVFFLIMIALPVTLIWYNAYFISDHYMYLPSIGLFYALGLMADKVLQKGNKAINKTGYLLLGGYIALMAMITYQYCKAWRNDITLWTHVIDLYPDASLTSIAYNDRGHAYQFKNEEVQAISDLNRAISLSGRYKDAYINRALFYLQQKQYDLAMKDYTAVLDIDPGDVRALNDMGSIYVSSGQYARCVELLTKSIKMHPDYYFLYFNRGIVLMDLKQYKEAAQDFSTVLSFNPQNTEASSKYHEVLGLLKQ